MKNTHSVSPNPQFSCISLCQRYPTSIKSFPQWSCRHSIHRHRNLLKLRSPPLTSGFHIQKHSDPRPSLRPTLQPPPNTPIIVFRDPTWRAHRPSHHPILHGPCPIHIFQLPDLHAIFTFRHPNPPLRQHLRTAFALSQRFPALKLDSKVGRVVGSYGWFLLAGAKEEGRVEGCSLCEVCDGFAG